MVKASSLAAYLAAPGERWLRRVHLHSVLVITSVALFLHSTLQRQLGPGTLQLRQYKRRARLHSCTRQNTLLETTCTGAQVGLHFVLVALSRAKGS